MTSPMQSAAESRTEDERRGRVWALGLAAFFALSPILWDWTLHLIETPWARYAALFPVLYLIGFRHESRRPPRKDAYLLLTLAILIVILAVGGGFTRWGRVAVPLTLIAVIRLGGYGSLRGSLTLLWFVPLPHLINTLVWPELLLFYSQAVSGLEITLDATRVLIESGSGSIRLTQRDAGMALMVSLSGISYFAGWQRDEAIRRTLTRMILSVLATIPIQFLTVILALMLLRSGLPDSAQILVNAKVWLVSIGWILAFVPRSTWGAGTTRAT